MNRYLFLIEYLGGLTKEHGCKCNSLAEAWLGVSIRFGKHARSIKLLEADNIPNDAYNAK